MSGGFGAARRDQADRSAQTGVGPIGALSSAAHVGCM